ncbi:hypothetical protein B0H63DRAFT_514508 [Podospora didyma]|uniref:Uncharacterized protein n=1 Tax=Podospora didyma TaxID=330526 RepID=A0AAE0K5A3_9PEZI|nr:hypothetical protein B0H63DRAFT_514508 [Podospora didyma]
MPITRLAAGCLAPIQLLSRARICKRMDPISGLALACNIIDIVGLAIKCGRSVVEAYSSADGTAKAVQAVDTGAKASKASSRSLQVAKPSWSICQRWLKLRSRHASVALSRYPQKEQLPVTPGAMATTEVFRILFAIEESRQRTWPIKDDAMNRYELHSVVYLSAYVGHYEFIDWPLLKQPGS